jgi:hypothetical protein
MKTTTVQKLQAARVALLKANDAWASQVPGTLAAKRARGITIHRLARVEELEDAVKEEQSGIMAKGQSVYSELMALHALKR